MAHYMDRPQVVNRSGNHRLELSEFNHWSEPLKTSIFREISITLFILLETNRIYLLPICNKSIPLDYPLIINIARFDG